jgi:peptidoglycan/LPS O-acetylase OafA/YrhL
MARRWLGQVDAMRPVKQVGVVSTHTILFFAPATATVGSGAALLLLHVSREGFFFISAGMLTYAYMDIRVSGLGRFYRRRAVSVVIPYLCWNLIYFLYLLPTAHYPSVAAALGHLAWLVAIGYYQLYFLLVIIQLYLVFPFVLMLLRRTRGHHGLVLAAAAAAQVAIAIATHWGLLPALMLRYDQQDALSYLLYLIGGSVVAFHPGRSACLGLYACPADSLSDAFGGLGHRGGLLPGPARGDEHAGLGQRPVPA